MKLVTNFIPTGKNSKTFRDLIESAKAPKHDSVVKTASVKVAEDTKKSDEGKSSGQLDVEPLHQTGESTPSPHKKEEGKSKEAAGLDNFKGKAAKPFGSKSDGESDGGSDGESDGKKDESKDKTASTKKAEKDEKCCGEDSGQPKWEGEAKNNNDPEAGKHREGDGDQKKASKSERFQKISNLDSKTKNFLRDFWLTQYPPEYVDAMLADK